VNRDEVLWAAHFIIALSEFCGDAQKFGFETVEIDTNAASKTIKRVVNDAAH
jgi:hypothetical protein